ncbi:MAG: hypothetical protein AB4372_32655, partial [Xenococcus sp. (in: cyanobacteria)]
MKNTSPINPLNPNNQRKLQALIKEIRLNSGKFKLILARCEYKDLRKSVLEELVKDKSLLVETLDLSPEVNNLFNEIQDFLSGRKTQSLSALMILGLEEIDDLETLFANFNQVRTQFQTSLSFPLVLWLTDEVLTLLNQNAPDFRSGGIPKDFTWTDPELKAFLYHSSDELFDLALRNSQLSVYPSSANRIKLAEYRRPYYETKSAYNALQNRSVSLMRRDIIKATFLLAQGGTCYVNSLKRQPIEDQIKSIHDAQKYCQEGQEICHENTETRKEGILLYCLSQCEGRLAELERREQQKHWEMQEFYLKSAYIKLQEIGATDIVFKLECERGEILQRLQDWQELSTLAESLIQQQENDISREILAQSYGFLAKSKIETAKAQELPSEQKKQLARESEQTAIKALKLLNQFSRSYRWLRANLLLLLAQTQILQGQIDKAIHNLKKALRMIEEARTRVELHDRYEPTIHIAILNELRNAYLEKKDYLGAFQKKQDRLSLEGQYALRAFIGASSLKPRVNATEADYAIEASGRGNDVEKLIQRLCPPERKRLTIIHGPSGVGKTSMLAAGLVPRLRNVAFGDGYKVLPAFIRLSEIDNWTEQLGKVLKKELKDVKIEWKVDRFSSEAILQQLENQQRRLATVFIFDQFEDLFFIFQPHKRRELLEFLEKCLEIENVWVVLSLREDYLHYLLEQERTLSDSEKILKDGHYDWLSYKNRYPIKNLQKDEAKVLINNLSKNAQLGLHERLIDKLVDDLASDDTNQDTGEVRPIELQIVGSQIQDRGIHTEDEYLELSKKSCNSSQEDNNLKNVLIQEYLDAVVEDCGEENKGIANFVLFLLTDDNGKRPLKTIKDFEDAKREVSRDEDKDARLNLVLEIFVKSRLVNLLKESNNDSVNSERYQLVHDYLSKLVRETYAKEYENKLKKVTEENAQQREQLAVQEEKLERLKLQDSLEDAEKKLKRAYILLSGITAVAIGIIIPAIFFSGDTINQKQMVQKETDSSQVLSNIKRTGYLLDSTFLRALKNADNYQENLTGHWTRKFQRKKVNTFADYEHFSPLLALQQLSSLMNAQRTFSYKEQGLRDVQLSDSEIVALTTTNDDNLQKQDLGLLNEDNKSTTLTNVQVDVFTDKQQARISPNGEYVFISESDDKEREYKLVIKNKNDRILVDEKRNCSSLAFSQDSRWLACASNQSMILYDLENRENVESIKCPIPRSSDSTVKSLVFSSQTDILAMGYSDGLVELLKFNELNGDCK